MIFDVLWITTLAGPAVPALFLGGRTMVRAAAVLRRTYSSARGRSALTSALLLVAAAPLLPYFVVLAVEFSIAATCDGAGCAQGGIALVGVTPLPWLAYALISAIRWLCFNGRFLPALAAGRGGSSAA